MPLDPEKIGRYEVQCVLGRGAMGVVYLALDPLLKRSVAIKTMRDNGEDVSNTMERFKREAEISAKLNHPNIITVYDVGVDKEMGPFLAMEYIQGASLAHLIKENLPMDVGLRLLLQGMAALQAAEQGGIIHRDIKPENMLISLEGRFKLMDFGIARGDQSRLTAAGMVFGTPSYTAPELLVGGEPSPATDRYAFAVTAFEVFTGALPYQGTSVGTTLYRIVHEAPKMPETLHPKLQEVFLRALAKDPNQRYRDLPSFMWALISAAPIASDQKAKLLDNIESNRPNSGSFDFSVNTQGPPSSPNLKARPALNSQELISTKLTESGSIDSFQDDPDVFAAQPPEKSITHSEDVESPEDLGEPLPEPELPTASELLAQMGDAASIPGTGAATQPAMEALDALDALEASDLSAEPAAVKPAEPAPRKGGRGLLAAFVAILVLGGLGVGGYLLSQTKKPIRSVDIQSEPPGATVYLEGKSIGETPLNHVELKDGASELKLELTGFEPKAYLIKPGETAVMVTLELPAFHISVVTDPVGAEVFLNEKSMGKTPLQSLGIPSEGARKLRIIHDGYQPWEADVDPVFGFPDVVRLTPLPKGKR
ncbi:MAG: serine/threonine protein kinase [Holophagaceae bacterium]|nr:serine/threonine protein kinase [Holophagaceae bacterium]